MNDLTPLLALCEVTLPKLRDAVKDDSLPLDVRTASLDAQVAMPRFEIELLKIRANST